MSIEDVLGPNGGAPADGGAGDGGGDEGATGPSAAELEATERAELVAISKAAIAKTPAPAKKPDAPKLAEALKKPEPPKSDPAAADVDAEAAEAAKLDRALRKREAENATREETRKALDEVKAARAEIAAEREAVKKEKAEAAELLKLLRTNPAEGIKRAGWDPDELVLSMSKNPNDPGVRAQLEAKRISDELAELRAWRDSQAEAAKKSEADAKAAEEKKQAEHTAKQVEEAKAGFLKVALDVEKYPALAKQYAKRPHLLTVEAERVANDYYAATKAQTGKGLFATWQEIADYLESDHTDSTPELTTPQSGQRQALQAERAPGKRTLSPDQASQRRSAPEPDAEPTREELVSLSKRTIAGARA